MSKKHKKTIAQAGKDLFRGKRVLVRVDFNVPQNEDATVADDSRIRAALPTIKFLSEAGAKVILVSHLGRPKGKSVKLSLKPIADHTSEKLHVKVCHLEHTIGPEVEAHINEMKDGDIVLLENVRFHEGEEKNDREFSKQLAKLADVYVNDAFGTAHRAHSSTAGVTEFVKPALAGFLLDKEIKALSGVVDNPNRPFATIIGGAKVSSKIGVLENLIDRADVLVIGGAMAFTFLKAQGLEIGKSLVELDRVDFCKDLLAKAKAKGVRVILPEDLVCAPELKPGQTTVTVAANQIPADQMGLDVGPLTVAAVKKELEACHTILWNGPLGAFETPGFEHGTYALIDILVELTKAGVKTIIGGGDSVAALEEKDIAPDAFTHVSTGGGASLEFLEGLELPGVACLDPAEGVPAV
ncbi:MAG: phosphoglycerate kinase [Candidatus Obscuribacterales bacterium]